MGTGGPLKNRRKQLSTKTTSSAYHKNSPKPRNSTGRKGHRGRGPLAPPSDDAKDESTDSEVLNSHLTMNKLRKFTEDKDADALINSLTTNKLLVKPETIPDSDDEYATAQAEMSRGLRPKQKPSKMVGEDVSLVLKRAKERHTTFLVESILCLPEGIIAVDNEDAAAAHAVQLGSRYFALPKKVNGTHILTLVSLRAYQNQGLAVINSTTGIEFDMVWDKETVLEKLVEELPAIQLLMEEGENDLRGRPSVLLCTRQDRRIQLTGLTIPNGDAARQYSRRPTAGWRGSVLVFTSRTAINPKDLKALAENAVDKNGHEIIEVDGWDDILTQHPDDSGRDDPSERGTSPPVPRRSVRNSRKRARIESSGSEEEVVTHLTSSPDPSPIHPRKKQKVILETLDLTVDSDNEDDTLEPVDAPGTSGATDDAAGSDGGSSDKNDGAASRPMTPEAAPSPGSDHWSPDYKVYSHQYTTWGTKPIDFNF
ncbi:hypothetical protein BDP27DRAFT_1430117 [Rhodocollybia butyracea]|uniref:Uncharacterized protein n=1 Tax=Rhodocollybia butyracea TaxID=206335 RepID=A0A9P5TZL1_9AGAR|nr:hypothetical protein BDP27DRAFT_1430117 [Rhodocollybia butyracea]